MGFAQKILILMIPATIAAAASGSSRRPDLERSLSNVICQSEYGPSPEQVLAMGSNDARSEVKILSAADSKKIDASTAQNHARRMGLDRIYTSYAFGSCTASRAWVLAASARTHLFTATETSINLKRDQLDSMCKDFSVKFLKSQGSKSRQIKLPIASSDQISIQTKFLEQGLLSVYCRYKGEKSAKPRIALQIPVTPIAAMSIPHDEVFSGEKSASDLMLEWLNKLRQAAALPEFSVPKLSGDPASFPSLSQIASRSIFIAKDIKGMLTDPDLKYEGMISGVGADPKDIAWTLWYTPEFRDKILDKRVTAVLVQNNQQSARLGIYVSLFAGLRRR